MRTEESDERSVRQGLVCYSRPWIVCGVGHRTLRTAFMLPCARTAHPSTGGRALDLTVVSCCFFALTSVDTLDRRFPLGFLSPSLYMTHEKQLDQFQNTETVLVETVFAAGGPTFLGMGLGCLQMGERIAHVHADLAGGAIYSLSRSTSTE